MNGICIACIPLKYGLSKISPKANVIEKTIKEAFKVFHGGFRDAEANSFKASTLTKVSQSVLLYTFLILDDYFVELRT